MKDTDMKAKLLAVLAKQNPALAALCAAPSLSRADADKALEEAYRVAPWSREALAALDTATRDRYAAAFARETGPAYEALFDQLNADIARACPF